MTAERDIWGELRYLRSLWREKITGRVETKFFLLEETQVCILFFSRLSLFIVFPQFVIVLLALCRLRWTARAICLLVET